MKSAARWQQHSGAEASDGYDSTLRRSDAKPPIRWPDQDGRRVKISGSRPAEARPAVRHPSTAGSRGKENKVIIRQRRTGSAERTDTSESDDPRRFKSQRQKSQVNFKDSGNAAPHRSTLTASVAGRDAIFRFRGGADADSKLTQVGSSVAAK